MSSKVLLLGTTVSLTLLLSQFVGVLSSSLAIILTTLTLVVSLIFHVRALLSEAVARSVSTSEQPGLSAGSPRSGRTVDHSPKVSASKASVELVHKAATRPSHPSLKQSRNPEASLLEGEILRKDDYASREINLNAGQEFVGDVSATGLVNLYLLTEDNVTSLDLGEEFWYEVASEGVTNGTLKFKAAEDGKWFLVVENAEEKDISVVIKTNLAEAQQQMDIQELSGLQMPNALKRPFKVENSGL